MCKMLRRISFRIRLCFFIPAIRLLFQEGIGEGGAAEERGGIHTLFP